MTELNLQVGKDGLFVLPDKDKIVEANGWIANAFYREISKENLMEIPASVRVRIMDYFMSTASGNFSHLAFHTDWNAFMDVWKRILDHQVSYFEANIVDKEVEDPAYDRMCVLTTCIDSCLNDVDLAGCWQYAVKYAHGILNDWIEEKEVASA